LTTQRNAEKKHVTSTLHKNIDPHDGTLTNQHQKALNENIEAHDGG